MHSRALVGHRGGCGREEEKLREKGGNVLSDDRMREEWQPNQPRYGTYYILASVSVICCCC